MNEISKQKLFDLEKNAKKCFIISPIGNEGSVVRRKVEGMIDAVITPVLKEFGYNLPIVSHRIDKSGSITSEIIKHVYESELVIANLTGNNANVLYELALRHAAGKPVIHITENISELPFDISDHRCIEYKDDFMGVIEFQEELRKKIRYIEQNPDEISNPIYDNLQKVIITDEKLPSTSLDFKDILEEVYREIRGLKKSVNTIIHSEDGYRLNGLQDEYDFHNKQLKELRKKFDFMYTMGDLESATLIYEKLNKYIESLDLICLNSKNRTEESIYNILYQEAHELRKHMNNLLENKSVTV